MESTRRYDIDWLRVIAIGLLLIYHISIGFQTWGGMIGFITSKESWGSLWIPMSMLNIWRIPLLFFVSGMGVFFAIRKRNWKQLIIERAQRILLPFVFGVFAIVPLHMFLWQKYYKFSMSYVYNAGHLWFLANIFMYVVILAPVFFYLKANIDGKIAQGVKKIFSHPVGLLVVVVALTVEALILDPTPFEMYATTWHGFFLGLLAFLFGFCFVFSGKPFWDMILVWRWILLIFAGGLYLLRLNYFGPNVPLYLIVTESNAWIFTILAFGYKYLNRPSKTLSYLSQAAYPVYILHMAFLYLGSILIFPLDIPVYIQFVLVVIFTGMGCFFTYEIIRRVNFIRPLFGLKRFNSK